jgi:hypothetical protein
MRQDAVSSSCPVTGSIQIDLSKQMNRCEGNNQRNYWRKLQVLACGFAEKIPRGRSDPLRILSMFAIPLQTNPSSILFLCPFLLFWSCASLSVHPDHNWSINKKFVWTYPLSDHFLTGFLQWTAQRLISMVRPIILLYLLPHSLSDRDPRS